MERRERLTNLHGLGMILAGVLMKLLAYAIRIIGRSLLDIVFYTWEDIASPIEQYMQVFPGFKVLCNIISATMYVKFGYLLLWTVLILWLIRREIKQYVNCTAAADSVQYIRVRKTPYVWLGFLLGSFGAHLFLLRDKTKAWLYLFLGFVGISVKYCTWYTMGISFTDALLACYLPKDSEGYIEIIDYMELI